MRRLSLLPLVLGGALLSTTTIAQSVPEALTESLSVNGQPMPVENVNPTPMEGIYQVQLTNGETFYANADGSYFLVGDLYANQQDGLVNLTEQEGNQERAEVIAAIPEEERIIFRGVGEPKATIVVFTDTSCPYCTRLHETVPELNEAGVAVHYLAFPRSGMNGEAARVMQQAWCADNPQQALTDAKQGEALSGSASCDNPVASQYQTGIALGVQGTPAIILPDGELVPGFVPPERLLAMLDLSE
ncbi:MAG: DsbC family protein [Pseudomonadota bacterium]|jgi:thiol:disulfide interchange protein DsbC